MNYFIVLTGGTIIECNDYNVSDDGVRFSHAKQMHEVIDGQAKTHPCGFVPMAQLQCININSSPDKDNA